ncbi:MAG: hypothetical protein KKG75_01580 [Nanoarchaeota archaeon]|nr:hypothetical protein [Nanoarchaeota archaeon]
MRYELFTYPHCGKCDEIRTLLSEAEIEGQEYDLSSREGTTEIKGVYPKIRDRVQRDANGIKTPLIILKDNEGKIIGVVQDKEGLIACLSGD